MDAVTGLPMPPGLVVLRGNSASGKTTTARALQDRQLRRLAVVSQDVLRREVLRVRNEPRNLAVDLIDLTARYALDRGLHVVIEGMLEAEIYGPVLRELAATHAGPSSFYRFTVPFDETLRRHAGRPQAAQFGEAEMRQWWRDDDPLDGVDERPLDVDLTQAEVVERIAHDMGW